MPRVPVHTVDSAPEASKETLEALDQQVGVEETKDIRRGTLPDQERLASLLHDHLAPAERGIAAHPYAPEKETATS